MRRSLRLEFHARIAIALLVLAALSPTLSRLIGAAAAAPSSFGQVCSASGLGQPGAPADGVAAARDCPMCLLPGLGLAPCGELDASARLLALDDERPSSVLQAAHPQSAWRSAQARAPPLQG